MPQWPQWASTHHAIAGLTRTEAEPLTAPSRHCGRSRYVAMSNPEGTSKSCGLRVACTTRERMRDRRKVRRASRRWQRPMRYHSPPTNCRPYGSTVRSISVSLVIA